MQKIITFALFEGKIKTNTAKTLKRLAEYEDKIEVIYHLYGGENVDDLPPSFTSLAFDDYSKFVKVAAGLAKGAYFMCADCDLEIDKPNFEQLLSTLSQSKVGAVIFNRPEMWNIAAIKMTEVKKISYDETLQESSIYLLSNAMINSKNCQKMEVAPFKIKVGTQLSYHIENFTRFKNSVDKFCERFYEEKRKLSSVSYKIIFDILCSEVAERYICSLYLQAKKRADISEITEFDERTKNLTPFIYFGAEKHFKVGNLKKLRANGFKKIPFFTAQKIYLLVMKDSIKWLW